jgi:hypothetical protein
MPILVSESWGRRICWVLAGIDAVLGAAAVLLPGTYLAIMHPHLPAAERPEDWVVRTGILWLAFMMFEVRAATAADPMRWFFAVALLRIMEVPADVSYGLLAQGASSASRFAIFAAVLGNALAGTFLLMLFRRQTVRESETRRGADG